MRLGRRATVVKGLSLFGVWFSGRMGAGLLKRLCRLDFCDLKEMWDDEDI